MFCSNIEITVGTFPPYQNFLFYFILRYFILFYFILFYFILFYLSFVFLGPHPWHMEVPRLGAQLELKLLAYTTATATLYLSHTYTTAQSNAGYLAN